MPRSLVPGSKWPYINTNPPVQPSINQLAITTRKTIVNLGLNRIQIIQNWNKRGKKKREKKKEKKEEQNKKELYEN